MVDQIRHNDIYDMPDVGGSNRDHDRRYVLRSQAAGLYLTANGATIIDSDGTSSDTVADLQVLLDGSFYDLTEVTGIPGMNLEVDFTGVASITNILVRCRYAGTSTHYIQFGLYNYDDTDWDIINTIPYYAYGYQRYDVLIPDDSDYISGGAAKVRFYHPTTGNASHHLYIDYVGLRYYPK